LALSRLFPRKVYPAGLLLGGYQGFLATGLLKPGGHPFLKYFVVSQIKRLRLEFPGIGVPWVHLLLLSTGLGSDPGISLKFNWARFNLGFFHL